MIDERTETRFRGLHADVYNKEFIQIWKEVLADMDIQAALSRLLFVPSAEPDADQALLMLEVFKALLGEPHRLTFHEDLVTVSGRIVAVKTSTSNEGPCFEVTYAYTVKGSGETIEVFHRFGYDGMESAMAGWGIRRLEDFWRAGRTITCRYRKDCPTEHAAEAPFAWRAPRNSARLQMRGA